MLDNEEKKEMREVAHSPQFKNDLRRVSETRYNPFIVNGNVDLDRVIEFLNEFNNFISHNQRPFRKIIDKICKL
ncbi:MAG: hypothetical protein FJZ16_07885 [Candidatus Omnitrophica bacterium]|nr:hypothetical protein [Candidatus Omnitrophota bacterium]